MTMGMPMIAATVLQAGVLIMRVAVGGPAWCHVAAVARLVRPGGLACVHRSRSMPRSDRVRPLLPPESPGQTELSYECVSGDFDRDPAGSHRVVPGQQPRPRGDRAGVDQ